MEKSPKFVKIEYINSIIENAIITICIIISLAVLLGWIFEVKEILTISREGATMKFNTALVFLFSGINLYLLQKEKKKYLIINKILSVIILLIGIETLAEYLGFDKFQLSNLIVIDKVSTIDPGMMSPATAICSALLGLYFIFYNSSIKFLKTIADNSKIVVSIISFFSIISYIHFVPISSKPSLFKTMAIHSSILFFLISCILVLKSPNSLFNELIWGKYEGSKIFRQLVAKIIIFPIVLGNILLLSLDIDFVTTSFGITTFTLILIVLGISYVSFISINLNENDKEKIRLSNMNELKNQNLSLFKSAINQAAIVVITDNRGKVRYVNGHFSKISQYTEEEILGKKYSIINSNYHEDSFFKHLWETIDSGKIWVGEIRNKKKDGTTYWIHSSIIPIKNDDGNVKEFMAIDRVIDTPSKN